MTHRIALPLALGLAWALTAAAPLAGAERAPPPGSEAAVRATAESALLVTGTIDVNAAGDVVAFTLYDQDTLPAGVVRMANEHVPAWKFQPAVLPEGVQASRMSMSMLFVASRTPDGQLKVELRHPVFRALKTDRPIRLAGGTRGFKSPQLVDRTSMGGTVHAVVRFDRAGTIIDAMVEQVNLDTVDTEASMARWREMFAKVLLRDLRKARMEVPEGAFADGQETMVGRIALRYVREGTPKRQPGQWFTYIPGPRARVPWPDAVNLTTPAPDALAPDQLQTDDGGTRRLRDTPTN